MAARETVQGGGWGFPERGEVINRGLTAFFQCYFFLLQGDEIFSLTCGSCSSRGKEPI